MFGVFGSWCIGAVVLQLQKDFPAAKILLLGVVPRSRPNDPVRATIAEINRTIGRLIDFGMARICGAHLEVRTVVPPVPLRVRKRLPPVLADTLADRDRRCLDRT